MQKVVITEKYSTVLGPQLLELACTPSHNRVTLQQKEMAMFCKRFNLAPEEFEEPITFTKAQSTYKRESLESTSRKLSEFPSVFSKSVNQVLHDKVANDYRCKNTKLSNFRVGNLLWLSREKSDSVLQLLKKSFSDQIIKRNKITQTLHKSKMNYAKVTQQITGISQSIQKQLNSKRTVEEKVPKWKDVEQEFQQTKAKEYRSLKANIYIKPEVKIEDREKADVQRLYAKYETFWKSKRDFSVRKQLQLTPTLVPKDPPGKPLNVHSVQVI